MHRLASSNLQMMNAFLGNVDEAIEELGKVEEGEDIDSYQITIKKAMLLKQAGKVDRAKEALQRIPSSFSDMRLKRLRARLEASR